MGELCGVVVWVGIQLDAGPARPSRGERMGDRSRSKDGIDAFERNGCAQGFDHLLHPRKNAIGPELIGGQWGTDEDGICALGTGGDGEDEI